MTTNKVSSENPFFSINTCKQYLDYQTVLCKMDIDCSGMVFSTILNPIYVTAGVATPILLCSSKLFENKKEKPPTRPNFSLNVDENLKGRKSLPGYFIVDLVMQILSYPYFLAHVLGAQKNHLLRRFF